ncbi:MAG: class I SAM-dependent methyltransferase [Ferruginibacter sp.]
MRYNTTIQDLLGQTDIYLIDQIMKGRYQPGDQLLDAGCGYGRNLHWFLHNGFNIKGIDISEVAIEQLKDIYPDLQAGSLLVSSLENVPYSDNHFDHIICSAVLHFAESTAQFNLMLSEMVRILKPGGSLFIRMTSDIGIETKVELIGNGVFKIPDGSTRFLLTRQLLDASVRRHNLSLIEPLKTVNVADIRCMSTLLLQKN